MSQNSQSVLRTLSVLDFFADHPGQSFTLTDIIRSLRLSRSTAHVLISSLVHERYLFRNSDKTYILGPRLVALAKVADKFYSPLVLARPEMRRLADKYDAVCSAVARRGEDIVLLERAASAKHLGWAVTHEVRRPFTPPYANTFMAWENERRIDEWLNAKAPGQSAETLAEYKEEMAAFRERGYSISVTRQQEIDSRPVADIERGTEREIFYQKVIDPDHAYESIAIMAPTFNEFGQTDFALSLLAFNRAIPGHELLTIGDELKRACGRISAYFSRDGNGPPSPI